MNNQLEEALNKPRNYGIGMITTLKNYLPVFNPETKITFIEGRAKRVYYEYCIWKPNRLLEIPKVVYDSLDLPEEIMDSRFE